MVGMEASLLSAAVTGMLKILGNKLAPLVIKECSSIVGLKRDLQELKHQVQEINFNLERAGDRDPKDAPWLKKLKEVVYDVDDIVDEFQLKAEKHELDGDGGFVSKCLLTKKSESLVLQCRAAKNIKKINKRFAKIVKQRNDMKAIFGNDPVIHINKTATNMQTLPVEEATVLGRNQEMNQIISDLVENNDKNEIKIVSIVGLGGSGKTTLAKQVFNDGETIENHFDVRLWVYVSQEFDIETIIKKLYEAFADKDQGQPSLPYMSKRVQEGLTKKFLIVMDDVWTESQNEWDKIMGYLKKGAPGSGVLLTTRSAEVAEVVRSTCQFRLQPLSRHDSWQLFQQSLGMRVKHLEPEFIEVGKEIVNNCGGVPLAIKVIAGVLHGKELIGEWQAMRDSNLLDVEGEEASVSVSRCLMLSYFHLPTHMKQCFTICSVFPIGYMIDKEQLIDQWIAHDMITPQAGVEFLDIGDKYFNSLVQMSFLQDVAEHWWDGRVKCRMHDLVHDLALSILDDKISLVVPKKATRSAKSYRYFSLLEPPENLAPKNIFKKTRAVYIPRYGDYTYFKAMKHAKHLRSVMVGHVDEKEVDTISQVKYLKYLSMSPKGCEMLPKGISDVWSLQALHVTESYSLLELPKSIGKLKMLRTLNLSGCAYLKCLPDSIGDCEMISSIDLFNCKNLTMLPGTIGNLWKLRTLNLSRCEKLTVLPDITTLRNLECLDLQHCCELVELPEGIGKLEKLQVLNPNGCSKLGGMPVGIGQLSRLQKLGLFVVGKGEKFAGISELSNVSRIEELTTRGISHVMDPNDAHMACLKEKTNLKSLDLNWMSHNMEEVNSELQQDVLDGLEPPHRMKELAIRGYSGSHYAWWMQNQVVGGVQGPAPFPFLRVMKLYEFSNLKNLDGLVELPCLEVLVLNGMPSLESISGGPFPSVRLEMVRLECLGEVWMVAERTIPDEEGGCCCSVTPQLGHVWVGSWLTELEISYCPKLEVKAYLPPSLQKLELLGSEQVLQSPGQCQGSSSPPSFSNLKKLELLGSGHGWELLQHMTALESLDITFYSGVQTEVPESLWSLTSLRSLKVHGWSNMRMLPESLGELRSLQELIIQRCDSLTSLPQAMGQLTSLQTLQIRGCDALSQLPDCLGELTSLQTLEIRDCDALSQLPDCMGELCSLRELKIASCSNIRMLPKSLGELRSLQDLTIEFCDSLTSLPQTMGQLTSLQILEIEYCDALRQLPDCLGELCSLRELVISRLKELTCLPQSICRLTSLQTLEIYFCLGIKSLPEGIKDLTALKQLGILVYPDLQRRCEREKGEDWHLISHIPNVRI